MILLLIISLVLLFVSFVQIGNRHLCQLYVFNVKNTISLRGLLAILIIIHHLSQKLESPDYLVLNQFIFWGPVIVGLFFFFSGYGLMVSYLTKGETYLDGFLSKRYIKMLTPFLVALFFYSFYIISTDGLESFCFQSNIAKSNTLIPTSWFVFVILLFYFAFYVIAKLCTKGVRIVIALFWFSTIYTLFLLYLRWGSWWYSSIYALNVGTLYALFEKKYRDWLMCNNHLRLSLLFFMGGAFLITIVALLDNYIIHIPLWSWIVYVLIPLLVVHFVYVLGPLKSNLFRILGIFSYEIYIMQGIFQKELEGYKYNSFFYILLVVILSCITAYLLHRISLLITKRI